MCWRFSLEGLAWLVTKNYYGVVVVVAGLNGTGKDEAVVGLEEEGWLVLSIFDDAILPEYVGWHNRLKSEGDTRFEGHPYLKYRGSCEPGTSIEQLEVYKNYPFKSQIRPLTEAYVAEQRARRGDDCFIRKLLHFVPFHAKVVITGGRVEEEFEAVFGAAAPEIMQRRIALFVEITADREVRADRVPYFNEDILGTVCHQLHRCLEVRGYRVKLEESGHYRAIQNHGSKDELHAAMRELLSGFFADFEARERMLAGLG